MNKKLIFLNITWMQSYKGFRNDSSHGGGGFVKEHGWGHELFNFAPINGKYYGNKSGTKGININRLGANPDDEQISNVTVVWTATRKNGGMYIVGWYKNATLFRNSHKQPRTFRGNQLGYHAECKLKDAILLSEDERIFEIPTGIDGMGQASVWYAEEREDIVEKVNDYIFKGIKLKEKKRKSNRNRTFQIDSIKRKKVENIAIRFVYNYYVNLGYELKSVETEKLGWDLEATRGRIKLYLEVKGLSGKEICVELTHNEYKQMLIYKSDFRLCIVTNALGKPKTFVFGYSDSEETWNDVKQKRELDFKELLSARITA
jgi:hypothetical protein